MSGPLAGIRVLDLSRIMAGPWATQILADLGADVIKVERKGVGDDTRRWGPPYLKDADARETGESGYYLAVNRGKRSIELDLSSASGQDVVRRLCARSDILVENFKTGDLARYGLDYATLKEINPRLVYCSITGFGATGPRKSDVAYDFMIQAMGGLMSVTGESDGQPGGGPQKVGVPIVDIMTGMYATVAMLAALFGCQRTGKGEHVDIAMLDVSVATLSNQAMNYLLSGVEPIRRGNKHPNIQPQDVFAVRDGHVAVAVGNDQQFDRFCDAIGVSELAGDPRYRTNSARVNNLDSLMAVVRPVMATRNVDDWLDAFRLLNVPCGPINTLPRVFGDPQVVHREMLRDLPHSLVGTVPQVVSPIRFEEETLSFGRAAPTLGEHTSEILAELGLVEDAQ